MRHTILILLLIILSLHTCAENIHLDSSWLRMTIAVDSDRVTKPWDIDWGFDNRLWINDLNTIKAWNPATNQMKVIARIARGNALGLAVPKHLPASGPVYIYAAYDTNSYYYTSGNRIDLHRFTYDALLDTMIADTVILNYYHDGEHTGGRLLIANDGTIMITTPEFRFTEDTIGCKQGRVLRLNPDGSIPATGNMRPDYTYTIGHRNPQGIVQLPDGKIYMTEHMNYNIYDEVNLVEMGSNYGYPAIEGDSFPNSYFPPSAFQDSFNSPYFQAHHHKPAYMGTLTPSGLDYYDNAAIPEWRNCLIVGTLLYADGAIKVLHLNATHDSVISAQGYILKSNDSVSFYRTRDVCVAPDGSIYCISHDRTARTQIMRLQKDASLGITTTNTTPQKNKISIYPNPASNKLTIEYPNATTTPLEYTIINVRGQTATKGTQCQPYNSLDTHDWPAGIYLLITNDPNNNGIRIEVKH